MMKAWERLGLECGQWWSLAAAFYHLAHNDWKRFDSLPDGLKATEAGKLCSLYRHTGEFEFLDRAGRVITGSRSWYVYLGRIM